VLLAIGRGADAERELGEALRSYEASLAQKSFLALGKLAELRLLQGRDAEAEELIAEHLQHPALAKVVAQLQLARGDAAGAIRVLERRLGAVAHDLLVAAPLLGVLVEAQVAAGEPVAAATSASLLGEIAAAFASGLAGARDPVAAFEAAIHGFESIGLPLPAARARIALARVLADRDEPAAKELCRRAVAAFDDLGARRELDSAAELRRHLGTGAKLGPRTSATLTRREDEVLALLALGLSNAKIAARLFISPKTVEHHVGHILGKLGLETRAAAAAYAAKHAKKPGVK
jgi:DNA-binding CsgD family transcriptional regulator